MKNQHLIPINVIDIVEKINTTRLKSERDYLIQRLEAIRYYCENELKKAERVDNKEKSKLNYSRIGRNNV